MSGYGPRAVIYSIAQTSAESTMAETEKEHPRSKGTKLNGSNYNVWVVATQGELISANAWRIMNDTFR